MRVYKNVKALYLCWQFSNLQVFQNNGLSTCQSPLHLRMRALAEQRNKFVSMIPKPYLIFGLFIYIIIENLLFY